jgi:hypothetical protein
LKPRKFDRPDRPFSKFRNDRSARDEGGEERSPRRPYHNDQRPDFRDDEAFVATGELADIVGTHPLDRREILRRMWRHYQDAGLVKSVGGGRPPRERSERPTRRFEDRPPRHREGEREETRRSSHDRENGTRNYSRKPSLGPRVSTRKPSGKHPAGKRADALSKIPRRKFKDTRERDEG